jgi:hypothetical protein
MKQLKKVMRFCALALFIVLAVAGIGIFGVAPILNKDRKLFADTELVAEQNEKANKENIGKEELFRM